MRSLITNKNITWLRKCIELHSVVQSLSHVQLFGTPWFYCYICLLHFQKKGNDHTFHLSKALVSYPCAFPQAYSN